MKAYLPFFFLIALASCSTAYRAGQTPDDVYFSPARPQVEYVQNQEEDRTQYRGDEEVSVNDERYLRMRARNRRQWSQVDDYYTDPRAYYYRPYSNPYVYNNPYSTYYYYNDPRTSWNHFYNPYGPRIIVTNPRVQIPGRPRTYNLSTYNTPGNNGSPYKYKSGSGSNASPRRNDAGETLRNIFSNDNSATSKPSSNNNSSNNSSNNSRSTNSAPVRKF